jgi:hypothetical protein
MRRREFIGLLGGAAAMPFAARAQQGERVRRIGVLSALTEDDPESMARRAAFEQALKALNWTNGSNLRVDYRWAANDAERIRKLAAEIIALGQHRRDADDAGDPHHPDRVCAGHRPSWLGLCQKFGPARRQRYRLYPI